jgi:hypothetical protein
VGPTAAFTALAGQYNLTAEEAMASPAKLIEQIYPHLATDMEEWKNREIDTENPAFMDTDTPDFRAYMAKHGFSEEEALKSFEQRTMCRILPLRELPPESLSES